MRIVFSGEEFFLHHSGALYWPSEKTLIVSDLHLEKGSHFALRGFFLPPYDTHKTLEDLHRVCLDLQPQTVILLGDCFHDAQGHARLNAADRTLFDALLAYDPLWIYGNHDGDFAPPGFKAAMEFQKSGIVFRHEAKAGEISEISGHFHPKVQMNFPGMGLSKRCFAEDGTKLILPAFGAYTGGLFISDKVFSNLFSRAPKIYVLGHNRVYAC